MQAKKSKSVTVAPSPLNSVKLELAIVLIILSVLFLAVDSITQNIWMQLSLLFAAGVSGMIWIIIRTRATVKKQLQDRKK